jgi:hypothetical protein
MAGGNRDRYMLGVVPKLQKATAVLLPKTHIFLLSHMRAYTSLFGHIMGSNPAICGYYEMHIGYHSWKSPIRQKLLYFEQETPKPGFSYMFDKVLHNEHAVSLNILNSHRARTIFCLRQPQDVIPSILKLYRDTDPAHDFNSEAFATNYYIQRLAMLESIAASMEREFFYLDAESIKLRSDECLGNLSDWLQLRTPLCASYTLQQHTSKERYGDSSATLRGGRIRKETSQYTQWPVDEALMNNACKAYQKARNTVIKHSSRNSAVNVALT